MVVRIVCPLGSLVHDFASQRARGVLSGPGLYQLAAPLALLARWREGRGWLVSASPSPLRPAVLAALFVYSHLPLS